MNILYISQYFPPEIGATQVRAKENVLNLRDLGHSVTVLTELPNHPEGIIHSNYRKRLFVREKWNGISILRVWIFTRPEKNFYTRILFYLSFMIMGMIAGAIFLKKRYHVVYVSSPPFFVGILGLYLSRIYRGKFVFEVRDLWPQSAIELGELKKKSIIKLAEKLEKYYYKKSDLIIGVTRGICNSISKMKKCSRIIFIPNGANTKVFRPDHPIPEKLKSKYKNKFVLSYTGIIGLIHGVEIVIETANLLKDIPDILFLIIGNGVKKKEVEALAQKYQLKNVKFLNAVQEADLIPYILISQAALATAKKMPITKGTLPVKMFSAMACSIPVVLSVTGEAEIMLKSANAGFVVEPGNADEMAKAVLKLYNDRKLGKKLGENGRHYVEKYLDRFNLTKLIHNELEKIVNYV